jgi:hypothetical protein
MMAYSGRFGLGWIFSSQRPHIIRNHDLNGVATVLSLASGVYPKLRVKESNLLVGRHLGAFLDPSSRTARALSAG